MSLPVIELSGPPREQGRRHGEALREAIGENLAIYSRRFEVEGKLSADEVERRALAYLEVIRGASPAYHEGLLGLAEGSGFTLAALAALNVRYEILYHQFTELFGRAGPAGDSGHGGSGASGGLEASCGGGASGVAEVPGDGGASGGSEVPGGGAASGGAEVPGGGAAPSAPAADGCTSFALLPEKSAEGHLVLGQTWDWIPGVRGAILRMRDEDGLRVACFTEAGILGGKSGLNSAGTALCINGLMSTEDDWSRLRRPFHLRCFEVLRSRTLLEAFSALLGDPRSCSANFLLGARPDRAVDVETSPSRARITEPSNGFLVHTNHFLAPDALGVIQPEDPRRENSCVRAGRMEELLSARSRFSVEDLKELLRDHAGEPDSICRHEDPRDPEGEKYVTVTAIVMDLEDGVLWATDGPACGSGYQRVELG